MSNRTMLLSQEGSRVIEKSKACRAKASLLASPLPPWLYSNGSALLRETLPEFAMLFQSCSQRDKVLLFHQKECLLTISSSPRGAEKENKHISCHYDRIKMEPSYFNNTMR